MNKKDFALYYQNLGWSIIPTGHDKKPLVDWKRFQDTAATEEEIVAWWTRWPEANPALVTGKVSGVVVLDLDKKHGRSSREFTIPLTPSARSGNGGEHFFFKHPGFQIKSTSAIKGEGVDCRGDGGYVLLSPSINETGGKYEWLLPFESKEDLADMPDWFLELVGRQTEGRKWSLGINGVPDGMRNATAASLAGKILSSTSPELQENIGWDQFRTWNKRNSPALSETELRRVWDSVKKYHSNHKAKAKSGTAIVRNFANIESVPIEWLWPGKIAIGKLTMISGDPGLGKSLVTTNIAAIVSLGSPWPFHIGGSVKADVVLISAEDDPADTIKPRLEAMGADCTRIHVLEMVREESEDGATERLFSFEKDIQVLEDLLSNLKDCRLVVIDPISAYLGSVDSNKNSDIRGLLAPLSKLAEKHKVAIVLVSHLNKNTRENVIYRTTGSLAFVAAVRVAFSITKDPDNPDQRLFVPIKSNISKDRGGLAYTIRETGDGKPIVHWEYAIDKTADEIFSSADDKELTATDEAKYFLIEILKHGPVRTEQIQRESKRIGITTKTLRVAREKLKIETKKRGTFHDGYWVWSLPEDAHKSEDALQQEEGSLHEQGHLGDVLN